MAKTTGKRPSAPRKKQTEKAVAKEDARRRQQKQIAAVILFAIGIFITAVSLIEGAMAWRFLHELLRGITGAISYAIGPIIIYIAVLITLDKEHISVTGKVIQMILLLVLLCGVAQLFFGVPRGDGFFTQLGNLYGDGILLKSGGLLGGLLSWPMLVMFGKAGTVVIHILLIFVFIMLISGSTLMGFFKSCIKPVKKIEQTYVQHRERKEQLEEIKSSTFNVDVPLNRETPMPAHPVSSPNANFDRAVEQFSASPSQLRRQKREEERRAAEEAKQAAIQAGMALDTATGEVTEVVTSPMEETSTASQVIGEILEEQAPAPTALPPAGSLVKTDEEPLDKLINKAIDDLKKEPPKSAAEPVSNPLGVIENKENGFGASAVESQQEVYRFPSVSLLKQPQTSGNQDVSEELKANAAKLVDTLKSFGVQTRIVDICRGPTVTRYELQPSAGVKISKITGLSDDIALNLATAGVRIEAPIPNKPAVGIEVPNRKTDIVSIREIIDSDEFEGAKSRLSIALGKDIAGNIAVGDIATMPHLLIAGATGSGKSVCVNSIIVSILYKSSPDQVRLLMIDPKVVELGIYNGIPHLLVPVVTDPRKAAGALAWAVTEMLGRYKAFADNNVRDLKGYNALAVKTEGMSPMPQIVLIIDELADLMMAAPNEVEDSICRLAQMARAAGMHLIIATQRPSVDVITGVIKANIPSRIAFSVSSQVDSRTILDGGGAEKLLGRGDMLFYPVGYPKPVRVQGCFVSDSEVEAIVDYIKNGQAPMKYDDKIQAEIEKQAVMEKKKKGDSGGDNSSVDEVDPLFNDAVDCMLDAGQASTSYLQRRLKVGYARAARLMDELEERGIVSAQDGSKPRELQVTRAQWAEIRARNLGK